MATPAAHPQLRGARLPNPHFRIAPMPKGLESIRGFRDLQTFFPTLSKIYRLSKHQANDVWLDTEMRITGIDISGTSGPCKVQLELNADKVGGGEGAGTVLQRAAFLKVTHLLDPVRWMKGYYSLPKHPGLPWHHKTWATAWHKLQDPWNQAYVETIASYALGRLREAGLSPHFNHFYGGFCATADLYRFNLTSEFESMRRARWFWGGVRRGLYSLKVVDTTRADGSVDADDAFVQQLMREPSESELGDEEESSEDEDEDEEESIVVEDDVAGSAAAEIESLHSDSLDDMEYAEDGGHLSGDFTATTRESEALPDDYRIYADFRQFPVMMIAVDQNEGTMDSLLEDVEAVGAKPGTPEWELRWSAWLFQVVAGLSCAQSMLGLTHNDLHTNNIVWSKTEEEWLYYKNRAGAIFRVPTFGKIFRIIDFGRAIFSINDTQFISDDFRAGNDAEGQYCFPPLHPRPRAEEVVYPNPSFDLCRLAVSLFDALFPESPDAKEGGKMLSSEEGLEIAETVSPLYNMVWSWMIDDEGRNVLIEPDGDERFPDFDLYVHIAAKVHGAIPAAQFAQAALDRFQVAASEVGSGVKAWPLFY